MNRNLLIAAFSMASMCIPAVHADVQVATFEDLELEPASEWCGDKSDPEYYLGSFDNGSFSFNNLYWADYDMWSFFAYANRTATTYETMADQFNNVVGGGVDGSANYAVAYISSWMGKTEITVNGSEEGETVPGVFLTNSAWVREAILNGDGMSPAFGEGDWLKVVFHGVHPDDTESQVEFYLADYRSAEESDRYWVDNWQWCDLSGLGAVKTIHLDIESTKSNDYGITTPTYVCLDNLGAENGTESVQKMTAATDLRVWQNGNSLNISAQEGNGEIALYDCAGKCVLKSHMPNATHVINTSALSRGLYILQLQQGGKAQTAKVLIR